MNPTYDFTEQVALVTGAASGMGLATAQAFAEANFLDVNIALQVLNLLLECYLRAVGVFRRPP